ncbi:hypothetical protein J2X36_005066 [Methylobacterium sp. BE186]|uniref:hypothetical protein n=1 Tax=Methylobacterium sp. BE186 TaxID=2817715 RepID=UPI002865D3FA|nr:hypothetical protein [Methylobacterium sp. BE186]MDR7040284.1 hypothetical protein [Methylobacterium sp. BE186]
MAKPVECRIVNLPDLRFAVVGVLACGKVFRRAGLMTLAGAEESVSDVRTLMAACEAPLIRQPPTLPDIPCSGPDNGPSARIGPRPPCGPSSAKDDP